MVKEDENLLYQKIDIRGESCKRLQQKYNHYNPKTILHP